MLYTVQKVFTFRDPRVTKVPGETIELPTTEADAYNVWEPGLLVPATAAVEAPVEAPAAIVEEPVPPAPGFASTPAEADAPTI